MAVVKEAWEKHVDCFKSCKLAVKLGFTRRALIEWNKTIFGFCQTRAMQLQDELLHTQNLLLSDERAAIEDTLQRGARFGSIRLHLKTKIKEIVD